MDDWDEITVELLDQGRTITALKQSTRLLVAPDAKVSEGDVVRPGGGAVCRVLVARDWEHQGSPVKRLQLRRLGEKELREFREEQG